MKNHIAFPSIEQFKNVVRHVRDASKYHNVPLPTISFLGTTKLHGTNHSIVRALNGNVEDIYTQSRERITSPESDNAGSSIWSYSNRELFNKIFDRIAYLEKDYSSTNKFIQIYGEWCGGNVQRGVGLNHVPKMFVVFGIRVSDNAESQKWYSQNSIVDVMDGTTKNDLYHIYQFPTFNITIDFACPEESQNKLVEMTLTVENDCPVSRQILGNDFSEKLVGEGIVFTAVSCDQPLINIDGLRMKCKGEKHSASKVKVIVPVDTEKVNSIKEFVDMAMTENRLNQGLSKLEEMGLPKDQTSTGAYLKWCVGDAIKENLDVLAESGLTTKDVSSGLSTKARQFYLNSL